MTVDVNIQVRPALPRPWIGPIGEERDTSLVARYLACRWISNHRAKHVEFRTDSKLGSGWILEIVKTERSMIAAVEPARHAVSPR